MDEHETESGATADATTSEAANPLRLLLDVQARDLELDRIEYRRREHPERVHLGELDKRRAGFLLEEAALQTGRTTLSAKQAELETHVVSLESRLAAIDARLRSADAGSFRDQQAMGGERESLDRRRRALEDQEIEIMEQLEPLDAEIARLTELRQQVDAERAAVAAVIEEAVTLLGADSVTVAAERRQLAAGLPPDLAATYERLRSKLGIGAAKLVDGTCSGCHLKLPARERDRIIHAAAGTVFYCEQCGRILVP